MWKIYLKRWKAFHRPKVRLLDKGGSSCSCPVNATSAIDKVQSFDMRWTEKLEGRVITRWPCFGSFLASKTTSTSQQVFGLSESQNLKHDNSALQQQANQVQEIEECAHKACKRLLPATNVKWFIMLDKSKNDPAFHHLCTSKIMHVSVCLKFHKALHMACPMQGWPLAYLFRSWMRSLRRCTIESWSTCSLWHWVSLSSRA